MGSETTCALCAKIRDLLGDDVPASTRLSKLDSDIWRLELLRYSDAKLEASCTKQVRVFGFSRKLHDHVEVALDQNVLDEILCLYEEEYRKQMKECEELIRKLESK